VTPLAGGPFPVVSVGVEIVGLNHCIKDVCRSLAKAGCYAIVPGLYTRKADLTTIKTIAEIMPIFNTKADTELVAEYDATVEFVRASFKGDLDRMAMTGFCRGGRTTLVYAVANPRLKAAVPWYGSIGGAVNACTPRTVMDRAIRASAERSPAASARRRRRSGSPSARPATCGRAGRPATGGSR
jgi:carboxymethylenebutenolidase